MRRFQGKQTCALSWAVAVLGAALLACGGVTTFQADTEDQTWDTDTASEPKILCCDGHIAESCPCSESSDGCCTDHDGVCGCRRVASDTTRGTDVAHLEMSELPVQACAQSTH